METLNQFNNWVNANPWEFSGFCTLYFLIGLFVTFFIAGAFGEDTPLWLVSLVLCFWPPVVVIAIVIAVASIGIKMGEKIR